MGILEARTLGGLRSSPRMFDPSETPPFAMVVDDDFLIREDALQILREAGFRVLDAESGDAAYALLEQKHQDVVLLFTDVQMRGRLDGFALARAVDRSWPHVSIVVASGQVKPRPGELPEKARFIGKPFSAEMVHGHLQEILPDGHKPAPLASAGGAAQ